MKKLDRPIFIFGTGRSGTTIFHKMLSEHPSVVWTSHLCNFFPQRLSLNRGLMYLQDIPLINDISRRLLKPVEVYKFWDYYFSGFSLPYRDLKSSDMTPAIERRLKEANTALATDKRGRVLHKITGWSRIDFLSQAFPDAKFIHIIRDGRAVANSMLNVSFWDGWQGPDKWLYGSIPQEYRKVWEESGESFTVLAAITWMILVDAAEDAVNSVGEDRVLSIRYEELCSDSDKILKSALEFCELEESDIFNKKIQKYRLRSNDEKYKQDLSPEQIEVMERVMQNHLKKYGYL